MPLFDTHIVVDWSARSKPSPEQSTSDAIWYCVVRDGAVADLVYLRTRSDARAALTDLIEAEKAAGRRVLVGFDFPFGYPAGVAKTLTGQPNALAIWHWLADRIEDAPDNTNNRYAVAEEINRHYPGIGPCWGRPENWDYPDVPTTQKARTGSGQPPERRLADATAKGAKTVWQLAYAGSVGSQVLLGLPVVLGLRTDTGSAVWPFDTGLRAPTDNAVLAEIYPSLLQAQAHADRAEGEPLDAAQVRVTARTLAKLDAQDKLAALFAPPVTPQEREVIEREEAWILGVGFENDLRAAA
ncbi:MAG: molybdopterin guanine dinucleotide synthesis [Pseudomonadota bacterium]